MGRKKKYPQEGEIIKIDPITEAENKDLEAKGLKALRTSIGQVGARRRIWAYECRTCGGFWQPDAKPFHFDYCKKPL